ncbi:Na+/Ca+ antiporter, CaCA family [Desulfatibacillum aliphaticivorans]|uniref:Na+/Ca+ antiporter, CaCA family n=1 Tax=Desulfatibacillum aliphaticivorans TaxID=218208 RepID=B8FFX8_DESAL|nr:calcium/sodium antiporter [Desulfatibacillum aliphaticivorans]ACL03533.1 Na+/Ca+ antiporter, CaCA family [Desulfatibacillum aliphaticivorans]
MFLLGMAGGLALLILGAEILVRGGSALARRFNISELVVGLTIVAFGTSGPEMIVSVVSAVQGSTSLAVSNVLGSNLFNLLVILGISSMLSPLGVDKNTVWKGIPFLLLTCAAVFLLAEPAAGCPDTIGALTRFDGYVLLCFFAIFLYYTFSIAKSSGELQETGKSPPEKMSGFLMSGFIAGGLVLLILGGRIFVASAVVLAKKLGMSESLVGLTVVAAGTSLPELASSLMAAYRGRIGMAVGNVVGSNIFNVFLVLGVSAAIRPAPLSPGDFLDNAAVALASLALFLFMFTGKKRSIDRWEGAVFVFAFAAYLWFKITSS